MDNQSKMLKERLQEKKNRKESSTGGNIRKKNLTCTNLQTEPQTEPYEEEHNIHKTEPYEEEHNIPTF